MLLAIDIGNTKIMVGVFQFDTGRLRHHWRISSDLSKTSDEYAVTFNDLFMLEQFDLSNVKGAIIASVVPSLTSVVSASVEKVFSVPVQMLTHTTNIPLINRYKNPREVGMDRLANAVGGKELFGAPLIIVDFGTSITLDVISPDEEYLGGIILPGPDIAADALSSKTATLPRISIDIPENVLGQDTVSSIQSGLYYGNLCAIEGLIRRLWNELGFTCDVVATGGLGSLFAEKSELISKSSPYLTLYGLRAIWEQHKE